MARQNISTGSAANDGTGDTLRAASQKINQNFAELYAFLGGGDSVSLSSNITIEDTAIAYEGNTHTTRLTAADPSGDITAEIPATSGTIVIDAATQTLTNKTLTSPNITTPKVTTSINDTNNNEIIKLTAANSAVNEITITNSATGVDPSIEASGETNRNLLLKGSSTTGAVLVERLALDTVDQGASSTVNLTAAHVYFSASTPSAVSLPDGNVEGQILSIVNKKTFSIDINPTSSNIASASTAISLEEKESVLLIWDGSLWYILGGYGYSIS